MIPQFNEVGYLPPGIHHATLEEIAARTFATDRDLVAKGMVEVIR